jgi:hypothetical protein
VSLSSFLSQGHVDGYLDTAQQNGFDVVFVDVVPAWLQLGTLAYTDHSSEDPDPQTFRILENIVTSAHKRGMSVHFWAWGDERRKWTPVGLTGGINGPVDQRLQRYIAARLGPLPGWTMGYGFDLQEWVTEPQVGKWAEYMHQHLGWDHLLMGRGRFHPELDVNSYSDAVNKSGQ